MVNKEIIAAKIAHIQKGMDRIKSKQGSSLTDFLANRDTQDVVVLNLQTAIQGCIDIASHIISDNTWGVPGTLSGLFDILFEKNVICDENRTTMRFMAGFRNLIVHEYDELDMEKVYDIFNNNLSDFNKYLKEISVYCRLL